MSKVASTDAKQPGATSHRMFAAYYERLSRGAPEKQFMDPLRKEVTAQAHGLVLEIGAGNGLNFAYYNPENIERVEAMEPDNAMLGYALLDVEHAMALDPGVRRELTLRRCNF